MQIETFEQTETNNDGSAECGDESIAIIEELDLQGQRELITPEGEVSLWRLMTLEERAVYDLLCPEKTALDEYRDGPIPLRVLLIAKAAVGDFKKLYVLHPESSRVKDPVLVGVKGNDWSSEYYILARWGAELGSFTEMAEQALKLWTAKVTSACRKIVSQASALGQRAEGGELTAVEMVKSRGGSPSDFHMPGA